MSRVVFLHAASLLETEARTIARCNRRGDVWDDPGAEADYNDLTKTAAHLREIANQPMESKHHAHRNRSK